VKTEEHADFNSHRDYYDAIKSTMLFAMELELQNCFGKFSGPYEILEELKTMFQTQARSERYAISEKFFNCKMEEGSYVSEHAIKMLSYTQRLEQLDCKIPEELKIDKVLQSLPPSYKCFVVTHNQIGTTDTITELFARLKAADVDIKKDNHVLMVNKTTSFKKAKGAKGSFKKGSCKCIAPTKKKLKPDTECFYCKDKGH
jgi:hypothetical protein